MRSGSGIHVGYCLTDKGQNEGEKIYSNPNFPTSQSAIEQNVANYPHQTHATHRVGVPAVEAYEASIEDSDGTPANVNVKNIEQLNQAVYSGTLLAYIDSQNPDEKYRHYAIYKSGMTCAQIAKSENPDWESEYGSEGAKKLWVSEANRIQQQVKRFKEAIEKT